MWLYQDTQTQMSNAKIIQATYLKLKNSEFTSEHEVSFLKGKLLGMARCMYFGDELDFNKLELSDNIAEMLDELRIISFLRDL